VSDPARLARAAHNILTRSLGLRRDQNLLIFADASSLEVVEVMARAARDLGIATSTLFVPRVLQADARAGESLPLPVEAAIRESDAVLSCLSDRPEHFSYRMRLLNSSWSRRTKLAHAPGMTLEILAAADTDYDAIAERAELLSAVLVLGRRLDLVTEDGRGQEYRLTVEIGGWNHPPGVSDGVIRDGTWDNLPPGEVYVVPRDAEGQVAINGSLPGKLLAQGEDLILTFRDGRLAEMGPENGPAARHLRATQIAYAERRGDSNWPNLAEIGFGLNPAIHELTGVELVDGKKAHTLHIGLGHSVSLGGVVESAIHCDMIVKRPTVYVNGHLIMKRGDWRVNETDWRLDHRTAAVPSGWWEGIAHVRRSGIRTARDASRLVCVWNAGRGRWDQMPVGSETTARLAARIYDLLPENGGALSKDDILTLAGRAGASPSIVPALLWVMHRYDLVRF
jgi:leucyl aminopeptidase (aminopeptidase T)